MNRSKEAFTSANINGLQLGLDIMESEQYTLFTSVNRDAVPIIEVNQPVTVHELVNLEDIEQRVHSDQLNLLNPLFQTLLTSEK